MKYAAALLNLSLLIACGQGSQSSKDESPSAQVPDANEAAPVETPPLAGNPDSSPAPVIPESEDVEPVAAAIQDPGKKGRFPVRSYTANLTNPAYQSAVIYYPADTSNRKFAATTLSGGYSNSKEYMTWLGSHMASHGIITIIFTPTNRYSFDPRIWATGHKGALNQLEMENQRSGSPIAARVDLAKLAIMGFSMGGAGTALAVNEVGTRVKAAVGLCAYNPSVITQPVSVLHITGSKDTVASPELIQRSVKASRAKAARAFAKFRGMTHQDVVFGGSHHEEIARYATSWYKVFLDGDAAYQTYLNGDELKKQREAGQVFAQPQDYFYQEQ